MERDMSRLISDDLGAKDAEPMAFDVQAQALAMISFISNGLVAGAASPIRDFAGLSVNEAGLVLLIKGGAIKTAAEAARLIRVDQAAEIAGGVREHRARVCYFYPGQAARQAEICCS